jgi:NtrC-family two-component system sensor histidine kinase KinB
MTLRRKLVLAQAPLAVALVVVGVVSAVVTTRLGERARLILADNYRSVLAAQRMKDSLERMDSQALVRLSASPPEHVATFSVQRDLFEKEMVVQEGNLTESGEPEATARLRRDWDEYRSALARFETLPDRVTRTDLYFSTLEPAFLRVKNAADQILALNQDAMVRKSDRAEERAQVFEHTLVAVVVAALALGLLASVFLTTRLLRPLNVVSAAVRRFGEGDLRARAAVQGGDEIAAVATEFNRMTEKLERYRLSSLGELLQAQQSAQAAIDSLPDPVLLLDANGELRGVNTAASRLLHIDPEREGAEVFAGADPAVRAAIDRLRAHVLAGKGAYVPRGFEDGLRAQTPDGERIFLPRATPIYGETGEVTGAALVLQDATRLFRFDELKNDLVATVAHEFRTPLTSIQMALHLCTEEVAGPLTPKQADLLFAAREDCDRLRVIVDDLLNLSRIESGHIELHRRRATPAELVEAALDVHRAAAAQAQVTLRAVVPPGLPDVFVDPDRLQLVFGNLLSNAIRYSPPRSEVWIRVAPERRDRAARQDARTDSRIEDGGFEGSRGGEMLRFDVIDAGAGIAPEHQVGLFEKFFRVPGSPQGGSGLGLFISKGLVQAHGGTIGVTSDPGKGATFWFTIPAAPAGSAPEA